MSDAIKPLKALIGCLVAGGVTLGAPVVFAAMDLKEKAGEQLARLDSPNGEQYKAKEWRVGGGQPGKPYFSTLEQVNTGNVDKLGLAWALDIIARLGSSRSRSLPMVWHT